MSKIKKAFGIADAKISFVSLVDKAANERQFLITKNKDGGANFTSLGKIIKTDEENHYLTGVVYEPLVEDSQGNFMTAQEITGFSMGGVGQYSTEDVELNTVEKMDYLSS